MHRFRNIFNLSLIELEVEFEDRQKLLTNASTNTIKIYTHPNFKLAMQCISQVPKYGLVLPYYAQLKIIKPEQTTLNVKQKPLI